jgi:hypothetical protein
MKYIFAIDETGCFDMFNDAKSFVCGVLITQKESIIKQKYQQTYIECGYGNVAPDNISELIGDKNKTFHFAELSNIEKKFCRNKLLPLVDKIFISKGKPTLYANNQNWWLVAVSIVISEFLKHQHFDKDDKVEIFIDNRASKTFGLIEEDGKIADDKFYEYHNVIKKQIENYVKNIINSLGININIQFLSDTSSLFINLADVVCGLVKQDKENVHQQIIPCYCSNFMSGENPITFIDKNPLIAVTLIFQEISNNNFQHIDLVKEILPNVKKDSDNYFYMCDMFYDLIKTKINDRSINSNLVKIKCFVDVFICGLKKYIFSKNISQAKSLDFVILLIEYYSHIGEIKAPFEKTEVMQLINPKTETRLFRRWEKYVSYSLRISQIYFNDYNFDEVKNNFETLWDEQDTIVKNIPDFIKGKDEPTTAIIGTLAQTYAYKDELQQAIEYFDISKGYAIETSQITDSYLFTIFHRMKDINKAREYFINQTDKTPEEYSCEKKHQNNWQLLSYCKLRALELYINHSTHLPSVNLEKTESCNSEYPFPLIQKWEAIALYLEDKETNKYIIEKYFTYAIENLMKKDNGFTINTLALPIIQCFALINNQNTFQSKYNNILLELIKRSKYFDAYVNKTQRLKDLKNDADIWDRAMLLPFIYA